MIKSQSPKSKQVFNLLQVREAIAFYTSEYETYRDVSRAQKQEQMLRTVNNLQMLFKFFDGQTTWQLANQYEVKRWVVTDRLNVARLKVDLYLKIKDKEQLNVRESV